MTTTNDLNASLTLTDNASEPMGRLRDELDALRPGWEDGLEDLRSVRLSSPASCVTSESVTTKQADVRIALSFGEDMGLLVSPATGKHFNTECLALGAERGRMCVHGGNDVFRYEFPDGSVLVADAAGWDYEGENRFSFLITPKRWGLDILRGGESFTALD